MKQTCRTCKGDRIYDFLDLGEHPPAQRFIAPDRLGEAEPFAPICVQVCLDCALIQISDNVPPGFFSHYLYVSSTSDRLVQHFHDYARLLNERFIGHEDDLIIDIGSCDGVLLGAGKRLGIRMLGVEPASNLCEVAASKGLNVVNSYFSSNVSDRILASHGKARVVTTSNTFNIVDDLDDFVRGVERLLAEDGVFAIEVPHALDLIEKNQFDTIYHEHLSEFSLHSIETLLARFGMEVFEVQQLDLHGGSMRIFGRRRNPNEKRSTVVDRLLEAERQGALFERETYDRFAVRVRENRTRMLDLLSRLTDDGSRIAGYGAAAKGTTLLNYYGIGPETLEFIADRNELKHGSFSPGMHIPVVPPDRVLHSGIDYLLILAWNFADEIMEQQRAFAEAGGRFIIPIPEPEIVA